jgi:hypothetical protein
MVAPVLIASTDIRQAEIVSQVGQEVVVLFSLRNKVGRQSDITYGVELYEVQQSRRALVDSFVYRDSSLSLGEGETLPVSVTYRAPEFLSGEYELWLVAKNQSGLTLSLYRVGLVAFAGADEYIGLTNCIATVGNDGQTYQLLEGVDVATDESLYLTCTATNHFATTQKFTPFFETFERTMYGKRTPVELMPQRTLSLPAGAKEAVIIAVPKALKPQAYDTVLRLVGDDGNVISSMVLLHYVVQGPSATVQNVVFDKSKYEVGDTAHIQVVWTEAADTFIGARGQGTAVGTLSMRFTMTDTDGAVCANPRTMILPAGETVTAVKLAVTTTCVEPNLVIQVVDESGELLVGGITESVSGTALKEGSPALWSPIVMLAGIIVSLGVLVSIALWLWQYILLNPSRRLWQEKPVLTRPSSSLFSMVFLLLTATGLFFGAGVPNVQATTYSFQGFHITFNPDDPYLVNGSAEGAVQVTSGVCANVAGAQYKLYLGTDLLLASTHEAGQGALAHWSAEPFTTPGQRLLNFRFNYTTGLSNWDGTPVWSNAFLPVPVTVVCPVGTDWNGTECAKEALPPSAELWGNGCAIAVGENSCVGSASWEVFNATDAVAVRNVTSGTFYSSALSDYGASVALGHGHNTLAVYHGTDVLRSRVLTTQCAPNSTWDGERCNGETDMASVPGADIGGTSCEITAGNNSCVSYLEWTISDASNPNVRNQATGEIYSVEPVDSAVPQSVPYGTTVVEARDGATALDSAEIVADCAPDLSWNGAVCEADVPVDAPQVTLTVDGGAGPVSVEVGDSVQLEWVVTAVADMCTASGDWSGPVSPIGGTQTVLATNDATYSIQCSGPGGASDIETVEVYVLSLPDLVPQLSVSPASVFDFTTGSYSTLIINYNVDNTGETDTPEFTNRLQLDRGNDGVMNETEYDFIATGLQANEGTGMRSLFLANNVPLGSHRVYVMADVYDEVAESDETNNERSISLLVTAPDPNISLTADRTMVRREDVVNLQWDINGATFLTVCVIQGPGIFVTPVYPGPTTFGTIDSGAIVSKSMYTLTCTAPDGNTFTDTAIVETVGMMQEI